LCPLHDLADRGPARPDDPQPATLRSCIRFRGHLAAFPVVKLPVNGERPVAVGVLTDRCGSKRPIIVASVIMAGGEVMFAFASTPPRRLRGVHLSPPT